MRLSLLRSPKWPDPTADRGKHSIEYALYPHAGNWRDARTVNRACEYNNPLIAVIAEAHSGKLPASRSFIQLEPSTLILSALKKTEDSDGTWTMQWYESQGKETDASITLPRSPKKITMSNFVEDDGAVVPFNKNTAKIKTKKNGVVTVKIDY